MKYLHPGYSLSSWFIAPLFTVSCILGILAAVLVPEPAAAQSASLCSGVSPTAVMGPTPKRLSHPEFEAKGWKVMLRTGPSMDCGSDPIWADDNLLVQEIGTIVTDQTWSQLRFDHNGRTMLRWAETKFLQAVGGSGGCSGASPSNTFASPRNRILSHPEFEAQGWKVALRTGPSMDCESNAIWAEDNLTVQELGTIVTDQSWSLLQFTHNNTTTQRWAETKFLDGSGGSAGCLGATPSNTFSARTRTLSHPEFEARGWKVMLRTGPSMACGSDPIWADDNLQVLELGTIVTDQSWSLLQFTHNTTTIKRWAETKFLEGSGASTNCSGVSPSNTFASPRNRALSHPEFEARGWKVALRTGPSMDCESNAIWANDNLQVKEIGTIVTDQSWSQLQFNHNGTATLRWAETKFLEQTNSPGPTGPTGPTPIGPLPNGIPIVIYDTDMGPDIDDALGLASLHAYANQGLAHIAAVTLSRNSDTGARYIDLLNTFYARPDIPIGVFRGTTEKDTSEYGYTRDIINSGKYAYSLDMNRVPQGHLLMRDVLQAAPDNSVVIIQVGFSTNTARLLEEYPDLVAQKARLLSVMAGDFIIPSGEAGNLGEFNIKIHPSSAQTVFAQWPTQMIVSEVHLGASVLYPLASIQNDFNYVANHPIKDSYLNSTYSWHPSNGDSYDMRSWDITSVVAAIQPDVIPKVLGPGRVNLSSSYHTSFSHGGGSHYVLAEGAQLSSAQHQQLVDLMIQLTSAPPNGSQNPVSPPTENPPPTPGPPARILEVSIIENPLQCNGTYRTVAVVSGFDDDELVVVNVNGTDYPARSASGGQRTITWRCQTGGSSLRLIPRGLSSGLQTEFTVQTSGSVAPTPPTEPECLPAPKRAYPSRETIVISASTIVSYLDPLEPFEEGCRGRLGTRTFDEGQSVFTKGFAGGYLELVGGGWIRASAVGPGQPVDNPPPGLANDVSESSQALLDAIADEIDQAPLDSDVDDKLRIECIIFAQQNRIPPSDLDVSSGINCVISIFRSHKKTQWFDDIIADIIKNVLPEIEQGAEDLLNHPVVNLLGISDIVRCADGVEGNYCIYAAVGVIPLPVGKLPKALKVLRFARVPNRISVAAARFADDAARFARFCRITGANSFHKDTLVFTDSGYTPISKIQVGESVWAYNEKTEKRSLQTVENLISGDGEKSLVDILLDTGETITATKGHPFFLPNARLWVEAGDLKAGHLLLGSNESLIEVSQTSERTENLTVYNLTVANDHTYYAGKSGVLNHNANGCKFPRWSSTTTNHLRGVFNSGGRFVGYHSRYAGKDRVGVRILDRTAPNSKGIYTAKVQALTENGVWKTKSSRSTFFPDGWKLDRIQEEVKSAYATARLNGATGRALVENSSTGFKILIQVDADDVIIRAHPVL